MKSPIMKFLLKGADDFAVARVQSLLPKETGIDLFISKAINNTIRSNQRLKLSLNGKRQTEYNKPLLRIRPE